MFLELTPGGARGTRSPREFPSPRTPPAWESGP